MDEATLQEAGSDSPHLSPKERRQARAGSHPGALVIHEIVREEGQTELARSSSGLAWSGLSAGLSIGFSFLAEAFVQAGLPDAPWRSLVASFGYTLGFLIVVIGRQQLFTETTLTAVIPAMTQPSLATARAVLRVYGIVLGTNLGGTWLFAAMAAGAGIFPPPTVAAMVELSAHTMASPFWQVVVKAGLAGWLIGLMVWLLPAVGQSRPLIVILLTYAIAVCQLSHIVAGSVEAAYGVFTGHAAVSDYAWRFFVPTLIGNVVGGTALAAVLNHAPIASELNEGGAR